MAEAEGEVENTRTSKVPLVLGCVLLGVAAGLYLYVRSHPCNCGQHQVDEIAAESARLAEANGAVHTEVAPNA